MDDLYQPCNLKKNDKEHETPKVKSQSDPLLSMIYAQSIYESLLQKKVRK